MDLRSRVFCTWLTALAVVCLCGCECAWLLTGMGGRQRRIRHYPMCQAIREGRTEWVRSTLARRPGYARWQFWCGPHPITMAVNNGRLEIAELLLDHGADPNTRTAPRYDTLSRRYFGNTPLHIAVRKGDVNMTRLLLAHGADPSLKHNLGETPIGEALWSKEEIMRLLGAKR